MENEIPFVIIGLTGPIGAGCSTLANCIEEIQASEYIKEKSLDKCVDYKISMLSEELRSYGNTVQSKHHDLIEVLKERAYLNVLLQAPEQKFIKISMSALIIKLALDNMGTPEYDAWKKNNGEFAIVLYELYDKYKSTLELYNNCNNKEFHLLKAEPLKQIDEMLYAIREARERFGLLEQIRFFYNKTLKLKGTVLQEFGDNLRRTGNPFATKDTPTNEDQNTIIALEANRLTKFYRNRISGKKKCFVIDALRNPVEVEYFSKRYEQFYLVSLASKQDVRQLRLRKQLNDNLGIRVDKGEFPNQFQIIDKRDWGDTFSVKEQYKQNVSRCAYLADISISNDDCEFQSAKYKIYENFLKYLALIISPGCIQPTREETNMNLAYSLSLRSTCISRQVGAVITDMDGNVLGQGWNDVGHGQIGCGLRVKKDIDDGCVLFHTDILFNEIKDELDGIKPEQSFCFKDLVSKKHIRKKIDELEFWDGKERNAGENRIEKIILDNCEDKERKIEERRIKKIILKELKVKRLEYCRSLHAEENAILQVASKGGKGVQGGVIYTTTFPCELCAKKIYQSGIRNIIFTEPYPESISENVFLKDGLEQIKIKQFEGVKSSGYFKLYKPRFDKKDAQKNS